MNDSNILKIHEAAALDRATLVLAFTGWMDGGNVSTGTVQHLVDSLHAKPSRKSTPNRSTSTTCLGLWRWRNCFGRPS